MKREVNQEEFFKWISEYPAQLESEAWHWENPPKQVYRDVPKGYDSIVAMIVNSDEPVFYVWE